MKVDFKLHALGRIKNGIEQEIGFSLVGETFIPMDILSTPKTTHVVGDEVKNKILTELVNLLQLELYGKVMSNETEQGGDKCEKSD